MQDKLTTELISDASLWRLILEVRDDSLEVMLVSTQADHSRIHRTIAYDKGSDPFSGLLKAVYDNPLTLSDFHKIDILIDTPRVMLVPTETATDDLRDEMMHVLWPGGDYTATADDIAGSGESLLTGVDTKLLSFLRRTFPLAGIHHRLTPLARYLHAREKDGAGTAMYIHPHKGGTDIVVIKGGRIASLNTYKTQTVYDTVYFTLATAKATGLSHTADTFTVCGCADGQDGSSQQQAVTELRKYLSRVETLGLPPTLPPPGEGEPFNLTILPLCE